MKRILFGISLLAFLTSGYCLVYHDIEKFNLLFVLPAIFGVLTLFFYKFLSQITTSMVFIVFLFQAVVRYIILPALITYDKGMEIAMYSDNDVIALIIMVIELILAYLTLAIFSRRQEQGFTRRLSVVPLKNSLFLVVSIVALFIYIANSGYFENINYVWELNAYRIQDSNTEEFKSNNYAGLAFLFLRIAVSLMALSWIVGRVMSPNRRIYLFWLVVAVNGVFMVGVSRFSMLLNVVPLFVVFLSFYPDQRIKLGLIIIAVLLPATIVSSLAKFSNEEKVMTLEGLVNANSLNAYFSGPGNICVGLDAYQRIDGVEHIWFFLNDIGQNLPLISNYTDSEYKSNIYFNYEIVKDKHDTTQIVPQSIAGLFHFSIFGVFLYPVVFLSLALYFERMFYRSSFIGYKYVYTLLALNLSLVSMLNVGSVTSAIFVNVAFILVPIIGLSWIQTSHRKKQHIQEISDIKQRLNVPL